MQVTSSQVKRRSIQRINRKASNALYTLVPNEKESFQGGLESVARVCSQFIGQ